MQPNEWQVLIVEDEEDSLEVLQSILTHKGIASTGVSSAEQALRIIDSINPNLIIIDLSLPMMDGWTFLQRLQGNPSLKDVPKIAITAFYTPIVAAKAIAHGFDAFFPKPLDVVSFVQDLDMIVAKKRAG